MIKVYALLARRPDISAEQFHRHWSTVHRDHALRITRLRRYVQAHRIEPELLGLPAAPYDGIPEVWYDSLESAVGQNSDPDYVEYAKWDEPNFIDMSAIRWVMTEHRLIDVRTPLGIDTRVTKAILLVRRPEGTGVEGFQGRWWELADGLAGACDGLLRTAAAVTLPETYGAEEPTYDAFAELWWPDVETFESSWRTDAPRLLERVGEVADLGRSHGFLCEELRVIWPDEDAVLPRARQTAG